LRDSGVEPRRLMLELTETYVMRDVEQSIRHLQQFAELGLCIAMDDFGTGYSSLSYLQNLPLTHIKVDRSFVRDTPSGKNRGLLETVLFLADKLGLRAVAEGIETAEQAEALKQIGYRWGQGYWFGHPVPGEAFAQHLD